MITGGTWRLGNASSVVTDDQFIDSSRESRSSIDYYGGSLICESVRKDDARLICRSKEMMQLLDRILEYDDSCFPSIIRAEIKTLLITIDGIDRK